MFAVYHILSKEAHGPPKFDVFQVNYILSFIFQNALADLNISKFSSFSVLLYALTNFHHCKKYSLFEWIKKEFVLKKYVKNRTIERQFSNFIPSILENIKIKI